MHAPRPPRPSVFSVIDFVTLLCESMIWLHIAFTLCVNNATERSPTSELSLFIQSSAHYRKRHSYSHICEQFGALYMHTSKHQTFNKVYVRKSTKRENIGLQPSTRHPTKYLRLKLNFKQTLGQYFLFAVNCELKTAFFSGTFSGCDIYIFN